MLKDMMETLKHRGPDGEGHYIDNSIGLGHRRLSIIDLSEAGKQPMCNEEENIWITYNGEVYNYVELREELIKSGHTFKSETDTEVIIHAYEQYGTDCLKMFNGMFAFVLYDKKKGILFGARDRYGIKPFYYYLDSNKFVFASEIKAILKDTKIERSQNDQMIFDYLVYNRYDHSEETFFKNIRRLPPSHFFKIENNELKIEKWWTTSIKIGNSKDPEKNIAQFKEL
ncbi:MAG: asparagine synthetase B, partial [Candidatus Altiarchaeota archaeon]